MRGHWFVLPVGLSVAGSAQEYSRRPPVRSQRAQPLFGHPLEGIARQNNFLYDLCYRVSINTTNESGFIFGRFSPAMR